MKRQLLRNSTVVLEFGGERYQLKALSSVSGETSLVETTDRRKTLFANTPKQLSLTSRIAPSSISLTLYMTEGFNERVFFRMLGFLDAGNDRLKAPDRLVRHPELASLFLLNTDSVVYAERCFVETIDMSFSRTNPLAITVTLSAASIKTDYAGTPEMLGGISQGQMLAPTPTNLSLDSDVHENVVDVSFSFQQVAEWRDDRTLFGEPSGLTHEERTAGVQDFIISGTVSQNYLTEHSKENIATNQNFYVEKSKFGLFIENARLIHSTSIESIYKNRLDVSLSEQTGDTYIFFGE